MVTDAGSTSDGVTDPEPDAFYTRPILNSPYEYPGRHWELDESHRPTSRVVDARRPSSYVSPIPAPRKRRARQLELVADETAKSVGTGGQQYDLTAFITGVRNAVDRWRALPESAWRVTPETARLLRHWRHHAFGDVRPFFCQVEAVETLIWLTEVAPRLGRDGRRYLDHLANANAGAAADPVSVLNRAALKLVLGVRAFGTQLLCEQIVGRALRRQSYAVNEETGRFDVEYADVLGIPFDFTAKPVVAPPQPPRETVQVRAVVPDRDACEIRFPRVQGYRVELPDDRLAARFDDDSTLILTPELVGPAVTRNEAIIGEGVDLTLVHTNRMRRATLLYHLTRHLLLTEWRDPNEEPKLYLFGQLKRIARQWLDGHLVCQGGTYPAQLLFAELADVACKRITDGIVEEHRGTRPIKAVLDPYNPDGSTRHVRFTTSKQTRWETDAQRCHVDWAVCDSDWEAEFCRVAEAHPQVRAYVKNHNLGLEVPYRFGGASRRYLPDFVVLVDDGRGPDDPLHLVVEVKGYRREDAKEKKAAMETYWVPAVNHLGSYGRWTFRELTSVYGMETDFDAAVTAAFQQTIESVLDA